MKKAILIATLAIGLVAAAKPVSPFLASDVASVFFPNTELTVQQIGYNQYIYLFTPLNGSGFVLVSADDCVRPVLAWSPNGTFDPDAMPQHVRSWIDGYAREIDAVVAAELPQSDAVAAEWDMYLNGRPKSGVAVAPLVTTVWNQGYPFNLLCPYDEVDSAYSVTGCTATATAQIMKYWNHPDIGWGSHAYMHHAYGVLDAVFDTTHYRWNLMPDTLNWLSSEEEKYAVAELMYHVGVATNMNYSPASSGAHVNSYGYSNYPSAENALKTYFKYNPMLRSEFKSDHSDREWDSLMRVEIDAARPVLYAGYDNAGGHAFVLDGYDSLGMFHVNWGWGGAYDGYYTIDSLSPGAGGIGGNATYTFNLNNSIVIGIYPAVIDSDSLVTVSMSSASTTLGNVSGSGTYNAFDEVNIVAHANEGCRFVRWTSGGNTNPLSFLAICDITDTAIFERITGDTLGYCYDAQRSSWRDDFSDTTEWGIRLPVSMRSMGRNITAVQLFVYEPYGGEYTLSIYRGDSINGAVPVHTQSFEPEFERGWQTVVLDSAVFVDNYKPLWITVRFVGDGFPASFSRYSGNSDGSWYRLPEGWRRYDQQGEFMTWMLRAVLEPHPVNIEVVPADENHCSVFGGGQYLGGDTVTVGAVILDTRCHFDHWSDGTPSNPYTFVASDDIMLIAYCNCGDIGIGDIETSKLEIETSGLNVTVYNPEGEPFALFDVQGRLLGSSNLSIFNFQFSAPGVYLLRTNGMTKKIVLWQ